MELDKICRTWGDKLQRKNDKNIRIGFQNINGFGYNQTNENKAEEILACINQKQMDVFAMVETNTNWRKVKKRYGIWSRTAGWFEQQKVVAHHNVHDTKCSLFQPGGTAIITRGDLSLRHMESLGDTRKMGRWSSSLFRGKDQIRIRVVSIYVPHLNKTHGKINVYSQHQDALLTMGVTQNPITVFWTDFWDQIDKWLQEGEQLILAGDWNTDVRQELFADKFISRGLIPAITTFHGKRGPETHSRGTKPIDEIFLSVGLDVQACGYLEHGTTLGDHRPLWVDISKTSALGSKFQNFPNHRARRLKASDPRILNRYNNILDEYFTKNNVYVRLKTLSLHLSDTISEKDIKEYEKLDRLREIGMRNAESKCRKLCLGAVEWSPILQLARDRIKYFKLSLGRRKGRKINATTLQRLSKKIGINASQMEEQVLIENLDMSFLIYKKIKGKHSEYRKSHIERLAESLETEGKGKASTQVRNLLQREAQRSMFRKIAHITGKKQSLLTTHVSIKNEDGSRTDLVKKEEMEQAIIEENINKFHQSENTCPFLQPPLVHDFGFHGEGAETNNVAKGTYNIPPNIDQYTTSFLEVCEQNTSTKEEGDAPLTRDFQTYKKGWQLMREQTSSNGDIHFGHYKAAIEKPSLAAVHYLLAEIPFRTGYSPNRWSQATSLMILKSEGIYNLEKLRTLVLFEADFNHNNKWLGKSMMSHAIATGQIAKEQYSIPKKKCIDHVINRRLLFDLVRYRKTSLGMMACDLKSCYDRIVHVPAILAMRRLGVPLSPIQSMFKTIEKIQFKTRTAYGDSEKTYGGFDNKEAPVAGVGQGNGAGPQIWAVVSSAMFAVMKQHGLQTHFETSISRQDLELCGFAFVDDTDLIAATDYSNNPSNTMEKMQDVADGWEGVAKSTGGTLSPDKCWYYLIHFDWDNGKWSYGDDSKLEGQHISIKNVNDQKKTIKYLDSSKAEKMLGVYLAPDGNNKEQVEHFKLKTQSLADKIRSGHLDRFEAWTALNTVAFKSIEYALPALTLSEKECISVIWPLLKVFLPRCGISRTIKRDVLYGPIELQGFGLKNIFLTQGISHINTIIEHMKKKTMTGFFLQANLEQLRLEIGENDHILSKNYDNYADLILTDSWIQNTWQFMSQHQLTLKEGTVNLPDRRYNDRSIMEHIRLQGTFSKNELQSINRCRIFLQAFTLSDIVESNGMKITEEAWWGQKKSCTFRSEIKWPLWGQPSKKEWKTWRTALRKTFCSRHHKKLDDPLGSWLPQQSFDKWTWFQDCESHLLYRHQGKHWVQYKKYGRSARRCQFTFEKKLHSQPDNIPQLIPVTVTLPKNNFVISHGPPQYKSTTVDQVPLSVRNDKYKDWLHANVWTSSSILKLLDEIRQGTAQAATDGSYKDTIRYGTASWTLESYDGTSSVTGTSIVPGVPELQGSYRSELVGLLALLQKLSDLCKQFSIQSGSVQIYCDSKSAIQSTFWRDPTTSSPSEKHSDLISAILSLRQTLPVTLTVSHVKAHQDDLGHTSFLSKQAQLNIKVDKLARESLFYNNGKVDLTSYQLHPESFLPVYFHDICITSDLSKSIYTAITSENIHHYWQQKSRYNWSNLHLIAWPSLAKASKLCRRSRQHFTAKWAANTLGTGKNIKRWQWRPNGFCPFCQKVEEDTTHILLCKDDISISEWAKLCKEFLKRLKKIDTCPNAIIAIQRNLLNWRLSRQPGARDYLSPPDLREVLQQQHKIGWRGFLEGFVAKAWIEYQAVYFNETKSLRSSTLWASKLIRECWQFLFNIWEARNKKIHETTMLKLLEGRPQLRLAINEEWEIGLGRLPAPDFSYLFSGDKTKLLESNLSAQRRWLALVRNGRLLLDHSNFIEDEFITNPALRQWVGLIQVKKGKPFFPPISQDG